MKTTTQQTSMPFHARIKSALSIAFFFGLTSLFLALPLSAADNAATVATNPVSAPPTLYIIGDSRIVSTHSNGWGSELASFFDATKIKFSTYCDQSARVNLRVGRWDAIVNKLKPGDFVLVQFNSNFESKVTDPYMHDRPALAGYNEQTVEATLADGNNETVHTYGWYMGKIASDAKEHGATAILCSPLPRNKWTNEKLAHDETFDMTEWTRMAAKSVGASFIDIHTIVAEGYEHLGKDTTSQFFIEKSVSELSTDGMQYCASAFVARIKGIPGCALVKYLLPFTAGITPNSVL